MQLTTRDLKLLRWINAFGFVTAKLVASYCHISYSVAYRRLRKLVLNSYLCRQSIFYGLPGIYRITRLGVDVSGSPLPPLRSVQAATYRHDLSVVALSLVLCQQFNGTFISERLLRHQQPANHVGQFGHYCDGVLLYDKQRIAIEVELSKKGKRRREQIMQYYLKNFDYQSVWYFCDNNEVENQLKPFIKTMPFLTVHRLPDFLSGEVV